MKAMDQLQIIQSKIYEIRGQRVMLDFDLAEMYGTTTKALKQAVKRNLKRFPPDFMFELTKDEFGLLRSQLVTLNKGWVHVSTFPVYFRKQIKTYFQKIRNYF